MRFRVLCVIGFMTISSIAICQESQLEEMRVKAEKFRAESVYDSALSLFRKMDLKAIKENNVPYQATAAMGLAALYHDNNNPNRAIEFYRKANRLSRLSNLPNYINSSIMGIGAGYQLKWEMDSTQMEAYDSALYYYSESKDLLIERGQKEEAAILLNNIALFNIFYKKYETAMENLKLAYRFDQESNLLIGQARDLKEIGRVFYKQGVYDSAEYIYFKALSITDSARFIDTGLEVLNYMAELYEKQKRYQEAIVYRRRYYNDSKDIFRVKYQDKLLELSAQYDNAALELRNELQENKILAQKRSQFIILIIGIAAIIIISIWLYIVDQRRKNIKILSAKNDEINKQKIDDLLQDQEIASLQGVLEGQETERKRVAIDLHDRLGGILSMVKLHFSAVEEKIDEESPNKKKFLTASELLDLAAGEVRNISHNLMSGVLAKFGLLPALEDLRTRISDTGKLKVNLYTNNFKGALEGEQELQLYRIVQELMSNILKHSEAKETNIQLTESEGNVNLIVEDDGVGFNPETLGKKSGIGLSNLKARVAKLDGTFHIDSGKGAGTTISIDIPVTND